jgi:hypothetical protein
LRISFHLPRYSVAPPDVKGVQRENFKRVQIDGVAIGLANAASPFLSVFLTRLEATALQISLLTSMPAVAGFLFALPVGRFLQFRRNVVPWYSASRLLVVSCFAATGIAPFIVPEQYLIPAILAIWAFATLPQTLVNVGFSVVMNAVAGPTHRYDLMSRRWSILGMTTAISVAVVGQILELFRFPVNYQVVFMGLSMAGLVSFYFSSRIELPANHPPASLPGLKPRERFSELVKLVIAQKAFVNFSIKRFVYLSGISLAIPLFPIYFVREVKATDAQIGLITTSAAFVMVLGYSFWTRKSRSRGSRFVLLATSLGLSLYPLLVSQTQLVPLIFLLAGLAGFFQAGLDLVFFDELMKTVPAEYSATFVSLAQSLTYLSSIVSPLIGSYLATTIGITWALVISAAIRLVGFLLFALWK